MHSVRGPRRLNRDELRAELRRRYPWIGDDVHGPRNVEAGECERCGDEARLVDTCGPGPRYLGRRCATEDDWCDGHVEEAAEALRWLAALPPEADDVARLWWVATGEVRLPSGADVPQLP